MISSLDDQTLSGVIQCVFLLFFQINRSDSLEVDHWPPPTYSALIAPSPDILSLALCLLKSTSCAHVIDQIEVKYDQRAGTNNLISEKIHCNLITAPKPLPSQPVERETRLSHVPNREQTRGGREKFNSALILTSRWTVNNSSPHQI